MLPQEAKGNLMPRPKKERVASVMDADKIILLDAGKIVAQGTHEELLNNCEIYKEIYQTQNRINQAGGNE